MDITKTDLFNNVYIKSWTWGRLSEAEKLSFIEVINRLLCCHKITEHSKHFEANEIESIFSVKGYNKDADTYVPYGLFGTYIEAKTHLNTLLPLLRKDLLTDRRTKEPIDWLNIVENDKILASFT